jgi:hypothetical protein
MIGRFLFISLLGILVPLACQAASDEQKQFAFGIVENNAAPIAKIGDWSLKVLS